MPATPEGYDLKLPADFVAPDGVAVQINPNDPAFKVAREWAYSEKISQAGFEKAIGMYAAIEAQKTAAHAKMAAENLAGLGAKSPERTDAVVRWLTAQFGEKAKPQIASMVTKEQVEIFESIISKLSSQGVANFRRGGEDVDTGKVDQATYDKMSYGEKKAYAERMSGKAA